MTAYANEHNLNKSFQGIDTLKLIMSFVVVAMHTHPFENLCEKPVLFAMIEECAVPFFFICSGFFIGQKIVFEQNFEIKRKLVERSLRNFLNLYAIWTLVYFPITIYYFVYISTGSISSKIAIFFRGLLLTGQQYNSWILWYLLSAIYSLIFIRFFVIKKSFEKLPLFVAFFIILKIFLQFLCDYDFDNSIVKKLFVFVFGSGRIFTGFIYIPLGMFLARIKTTWQHSCLCALVGAIICYVIGPNLISTVMFSLFIFMISSKINFSSDSKIFLSFRRISIGVYFVHLFVWTIFYKLLYGEKTYGLLSFIFTLIISIVLVVLYGLIFRRKKS